MCSGAHALLVRPRCAAKATDGRYCPAVIVPVEMPPDDPAPSMDLHASSSEGNAAVDVGSETEAV
jgi:hypothetical protein